MSRYQSFRNERHFEERAREIRDGYKKMLDENNQQAPLYHFNKSIKEVRSIINNMESNKYGWRDEAADQLKKSLEKLESSLIEDKTLYVDSYQEGVDTAEQARKAFAQKMMNLVNSFDTEDWIECAFGEIKDDTENGVRKIKQKIANFIRKLATL